MILRGNFGGICLSVALVVVDGNQSIRFGTTQSVEEYIIPGGPQIADQTTVCVDGIAAEQQGDDSAVICHSLVQVVVVAVVIQGFLAELVQIHIIHTAPGQVTPCAEKFG